MASSSAFASVGPRLLVRAGNSSLDRLPQRSDRVGIARDPPSKLLSLPSFKESSNTSYGSREDLHPSDGSVLLRAVVAAAAVAGLSLVSASSLAITSDLNDSLPASHNWTIPSEEIGLSMAIPIPQQEVWVFSQNGFLAPLPRTPGDGFVVPFSRSGKDAGSQDSDVRCPQWRPSEYEMVLPDFQGRPKPFPRRGYYWSATFVVKGIDEAFLQAAFLEDGLGLAQSEASAASIETNEQVVEKETDHVMQESKVSAHKDLAARLALGKGSTCFSL